MNLCCLSFFLQKKRQAFLQRNATQRLSFLFLENLFLKNKGNHLPLLQNLIKKKDLLFYMRTMSVYLLTDAYICKQPTIFLLAGV